MSVDHDSIKANDLLVEGKKLDDEGKHEEAVASFDKAIEIKTEFTRAWYNKGDTLQKLERYDDALACYDKVIEIDPKNDSSVVVGAWNGKGDALQKLERYDDAIACYDKVKNSKVWNASARFKKGEALQKLERYDDAIASFDKAIEEVTMHLRAMTR